MALAAGSSRRRWRRGRRDDPDVVLGALDELDLERAVAAARLLAVDVDVGLPVDGMVVERVLEVLLRRLASCPSAPSPSPSRWRPAAPARPVSRGEQPRDRLVARVGGQPHQLRRVDRRPARVRGAGRAARPRAPRRRQRLDRLAQRVVAREHVHVPDARGVGDLVHGVVVAHRARRASGPELLARRREARVELGLDRLRRRLVGAALAVDDHAAGSRSRWIHVAICASTSAGSGRRELHQPQVVELGADPPVDVGPHRPAERRRDHRVEQEQPGELLGRLARGALPLRASPSDRLVAAAVAGHDHAAPGSRHAIALRGRAGRTRRR